MAATYTFDAISQNFEQVNSLAYQDFYIQLPSVPLMITNVAISTDKTSNTEGLAYYLGAVDAEGGANPRFFAASTDTTVRLINTNIINPVTEQFPIWVTDPYIIFRTNAIAGANTSIQISTRNFDNDFINISGIRSVYGKIPNGTTTGNTQVISSSGAKFHIKSLYLVGANVGTPIYACINNSTIVEPIPLAVTSNTMINPNSLITSAFNMGSESRTDTLNLYYDATLTSDVYYYCTFSVVS